MVKIFKILNKNELHKDKNGRILWSIMEEGTILKTEHEKLGYNDLIFLKYKDSYIFFKNYEDRPIHNSDFHRGNIGKMLGVYGIEFRLGLGENIIDYNRDLLIIDREYRNKDKKPDKKGRVYTTKQKWYKYRCNKCKNEDWIIESSLTKNNVGCNICKGNGVKIILGVNSIWDTHKYLVDDFGLDEFFAKTHTYGTGKKGNFKCKECGRINMQTPNDVRINKSIACNCGDGYSFISKYIFKLLEQLGVSFKTEVKYDWNIYTNPLTNTISKSSIDFVIYKDNREIPLEADGEFHRKDNRMNGQTKKMSEDIDKIRDENCLKYLNEETIRISNYGNIKENILNSRLAKEFDLSKIDWLKCEEFALGNLVKEVCDYWNNKEEWETTRNVGDKFQISLFAIREYLKKGTKLGWCNYDPEIEAYKSNSRPKESKRKPVEVFKDNVSIGVFKSITEVSRLVGISFGIDLKIGGISRVCRGERKQYKGFNFKFAEHKGVDD